MASDRLVAGRPRLARQLARLSSVGLNFDPARAGRPEHGWRRDERLQALPAEAPGPPERHGSWEIAKRLMAGYEFADPSMVMAYYDPDAPLLGRDMLLEVRYGWLRLHVGCRVADVYESDGDIAGRRAHVWGWSYRTLHGHFEQGEMHWEVVKWRASGEVSFRIHSYSRAAPVRNPLVRIGFRLVGRREQMRFMDATCRRMRRLTEEVLRQGAYGEVIRSVAEDLTARGAPHASRAHDELARNVESPA
jgi:uncharacterized protein (UPF0548 family)